MTQKIDVSSLEGTFPVDGDINPITREPIEKVTANQWGEMSLNELYSQRDILTRRAQLAINAGLFNAALQIRQAISVLDDRIDSIPHDNKIGII